MHIPGTKVVGWLAMTLGGAILLSGLASPVRAQSTDEPTGALDISVTAEVLGANAPVEVGTTPVVADEQGRPSHGVTVTWIDPANAVLGDERFTHHVSAQAGTGDLVLAGRGCGAGWSEQEAEVVHPCTMDYRVSPVANGDTHEYPVRIYEELGPLRLEAGTYIVNQVVNWWRPATEDAQNQFTIRLTYQVTERSAPVDLEVTVQVVEANAPVTVAVTPLGLDSIGWVHSVRVTWNGSGSVMLDDARFSHHVTTDDGDLLTAGRGCSPNWSETMGEVFTACTADLQLIELSAGETHEYPVRVYTGFEALRAGPGTYIVEETIGWEPSNGGARQEFTVRLTYTVTEGESGPGTFTPEPAASGVTLARWNGGSVAQLPAAASYWVTVQGSYVSYAPSAPTFVNQRFLALYPGGLPAGTIMLVVR